MLEPLLEPDILAVNRKENNLFWPSSGVSFRFCKGSEFIRISSFLMGQDDLMFKLWVIKNPED